MTGKRVQVTLSSELWEQTKQAARKRGVSASQYAAEALREALADHEREAQMAAKEMAEMELPIGTPPGLMRPAGKRRGNTEG
jgi:metal-responsive CopG/Arc/MetJ family transcriptional regulator